MPHFTTTDGVRLHFTRYGNPSPQAQRLLVLCPSNTTLTELQPLISGPGSAVKLDRDFSCLIFDYRGIGKSSKPGEPTPWPAPSMELFVNDVLELLNHVGWTSCHIIAFSFGAAVAQELLLRSVSAFTAQRVLLVCPAGDIDVDRTGAGSVALHELLELDTDHRLERMLLLADTRRTYSWLEGEQGQAAMFYLRGVEDNLGASSGALEGRKFQYLSRKGTSTFERLGHATGAAIGASEAVLAAAVAQATPAAGATESGRLLMSSHSPLYEEVAIFGSVYDAISPPTAVRRLHAALNGSRLIWFAAGHWPNLAREQSGLFGGAALAFLRGEPWPPMVHEASVAAELHIRAPDGSWTSWCDPCNGSNGDGCVIL